LEGLAECPSIQVLNISENGLAESFIERVLPLSKLRVLRSCPNPVVREIRDHRRTIISQFAELQHLDDSPVSARERRGVAAWAVGGRGAEKAEAERPQEEEAKRLRHRLEFEGSVRGAAMEAKPARVFVTEQTAELEALIDPQSAG
jgi:hypothetical protein